MVSDLIDTTEMYVRTVWELEEEGIPAIRARLAERLGLSAPAVSETVARLEGDDLMRLRSDRTLELTAAGRDLAESVMRKHRLAERLLVDVVGLEWQHVHTEACRWEHVISDEVEQKLVELLGHPATCPHGNPIPGLAVGAPPDLLTLRRAVDRRAGDRDDGATDVAIERISEQLQGDESAMSFLADHGLRPGVKGWAQPRKDGGVDLDVGDGPVAVGRGAADRIYVSVAP